MVIDELTAYKEIARYIVEDKESSIGDSEITYLLELETLIIPELIYFDKDEIRGRFFRIINDYYTSKDETNVIKNKKTTLNDILIILDELVSSVEAYRDILYKHYELEIEEDVYTYELEDIKKNLLFERTKLNRSLNEIEKTIEYIESLEESL